MTVNFFTASDGAKIAFADKKMGELPLVCLAGLTRNMSDFDYVSPFLTGCRVIYMDYRGRGKSQWTGWKTYSVEREARDALELMDHLGIERFAILGTSRGGLIGMVLLHQFSKRILGLCLNDIGAHVSADGLKRIAKYVGAEPQAKNYDELAKQTAHNSAGFVGVLASRWYDFVCKNYIKTADGIKLSYDPELKKSFSNSFEGKDIDLWPLFMQMPQKPLALIWGENSDLLTRDTVDKMRKERSDMVFARVEGRAHAPFLDEPEAIRAIHEFMKACQNQM